MVGEDFSHEPFPQLDFVARVSENALGDRTQEQRVPQTILTLDGGHLRVVIKERGDSTAVLDSFSLHLAILLLLLLLATLPAVARRKREYETNASRV